MKRENRRDVCVEDRSLDGRRAPLVARGPEQRKERRAKGESRARRHFGRGILVGGFPVMAKYESKISCCVYFGLCTPEPPPRAIKR